VTNTSSLAIALSPALGFLAKSLAYELKNGQHARTSSNSRLTITTLLRFLEVFHPLFISFLDENASGLGTRKRDWQPSIQFSLNRKFFNHRLCICCEAVLQCWGPRSVKKLQAGKLSRIGVGQMALEKAGEKGTDIAHKAWETYSLIHFTVIALT
jgi:hypothetical protein